MPKGYLSLMLHAHLPFVRHPDRPDRLEERWLYEAITETYIPLINTFDHLVNDRIPFRITMSLTPPLVQMLKDPLLQERFLLHLDKLIELSEKELDYTGHEPHYHGLALMYYRKFRETKEIYAERYHCDLVQAFKEFQDAGCLEIITCGATHGLLPILNVNPKSAEAQINIGVDSYTKIFGQPPKGIWLPECGYTAGVDEILKRAGIKYFFTDTHGITHADPAPLYNVYAPILCPSGVAAFARDEETSKQVWSSKEGYPGDPDYREYYKDIGFDRDFEYIKPYIHPEGIRVNTGIKYWRITGSGNYKEAYRPDWAQKKAAMHAQDFMNNRIKQVEHLTTVMDRKPIIVAPYDAELYGHWWYEGPMFIDFLVRKIAYDQDTIEMVTPSDYLDEYRVNQMAVPAESTWGAQGYNAYWLNDTNDWVYRHLHHASLCMQELCSKYGHAYIDDAEQWITRALDQAARELLLAESSDWPFIMKTGTMVDYAVERVNTHLGNFNRLYNDLMQGNLNTVLLEKLEKENNIFADIHCGKYYFSSYSVDNPGHSSRHQANQAKNTFE